MDGVTENDLIAVVLPFALAATLVAIAIIKPPRWLRDRMTETEAALGRWQVLIVSVILAANLVILVRAIVLDRPFMAPALISAALGWRLFEVVRERPSRRA